MKTNDNIITLSIDELRKIYEKKYRGKQNLPERTFWRA